MKRSTILFVIVGGLAIIAAVWLVLQPRNLGAQEEFGEQPTLIPASDLTPAPTPPDGREVALLTLAIASSEDGAIRGIQLERGQIIASYAPNVSNRPGEWTVEVVGKETLRYGIQDLRRQNVYNNEREQGTPDEREEGAHNAEVATSLTVDLVVPLYVDSENLEATEINIYDQEGNVIFTTPVDRDAWKPG
jgi:hypothetical protein